jgi:hypothetical protein
MGVEMSTLIYEPGVKTDLQLEILKLIKKSTQSLEIDVILGKLENKYSSYDIKDAVWFLISSGDIRLTPNSKLIASR